MRHLTAFLVLMLLAHLASASTTERQLIIHFEKDKSTLTEDARAQLLEFLADLACDGERSYQLNGHTDSDGSLAYNEDLSLARAEAVRTFLTEQGIEPELIHLERSGERDPLAPNVDAHGMALNRRVSITFTHTYYADTEELRKALMEGTVQHFRIDPAMDQVITGAAGTELLIRANSLVDAQGRPVSGEVALELTEALDVRAMIAHQLTTRSGQRLLETGGMLKVSATDAQGNALRLRSADPMRVVVPSADTDSGMELFVSDDGSDWTSTRQPLATTQVVTWREPPFPTPPGIRFKMPHYRQDQKGRPMKPVEPMMPREPIAPRRESYAVRGPWWSFLFPGKAQAQGDARYAAAVERHAVRMEKYAADVERFEANCAAFPDALERYADRKAQWDALKQEELKAWRENVERPALVRYNALMAPLLARYDTLKAQWQQEREASMQRYAMRADSAGVAGMDGLSAFVFMNAELGWINCDRFYGVPGEQRSVIAKGGRRSDEQVNLVFTEMRSILYMPRERDGLFHSPAVPVDVPKTLFAYTVIDGRPHVCVQEVSTGPNTLEYRPSSFAEIGRLLQELNGSPA